MLWPIYTKMRLSSVSGCVYTFYFIRASNSCIGYSRIKILVCTAVFVVFTSTNPIDFVVSVHTGINDLTAVSINLASERCH